MTKLAQAAVVAATFPVAALGNSLPSLTLDPQTTTVSGLSSGAFMAVQLQVAFSERIAGAGIIAGGPYGCADGNAYRAVRVCMNAFWGRADAEDALETMRELAAEGRIDALEHLVADQVYLFHGRADDTVARASMDALRQSYQSLGLPDTQMLYRTDVNAGHGFVTERADLSCTTTAPEFLIDCDFDQAGEILAQVYGPLAVPAEPREGGLVKFNQSVFADGAAGMGDTGYVYVPETCADGATCRLHIALHGCKQSFEQIGEDFVRLTGYNRWAEANGIVVLYPQAVAIPAPWWNWFGGNPKGCWDWWGYAGTDYLSQEAPQIAAIARMAEALGAPLSD